MIYKVAYVYILLIPHSNFYDFPILKSFSESTEK